MKMRYLAFSIVLLPFAISCSDSGSYLPGTARQDVEGVLSAWVQGLEDLDTDLVSGLFALDDQIVNWGVGVDERYVGWETYRTHIEQTAEVLERNEITVMEQQVGLSESLNVAWFNQVRDYRGVLTGGEEILLEGVRVTGVLEKRGEKWVIVSFHHSLGFQAALPDPDGE